MHNLALALHQKGMHVTGSDDVIFEPSKSRLDAHGLLPNQMGWFPEKITLSIDAIILGMHAKADNPELIKAQELGLNIYSYPEFIFEQSKNKTRVVIGGSHGKTTITAMILHVLNYHEKAVDYMVGAQLEGFDVMVQLTDDNDFIVLEGDEYLSSPIDLRPKFHHYKPNIALLSGIAWDHINVFPTFEDYKKQFKSMTFEQIAFPRGISDMKKYQSRGDELVIPSGCPIQVRGALIYNYLLKKHNLTKSYEMIQDGEKIKFCYLKTPNPCKQNVLSVVSALPKQFGLEEYIDYDLQFEKAFLAPLQVILDTIDWSAEEETTLEGFFT